MEEKGGVCFLKTIYPNGWQIVKTAPGQWSLNVLSECIDRKRRIVYNVHNYKHMCAIVNIRL